MIELAIALLISLLIVSALIFCLGFRFGGRHWKSELHDVRIEAARARRQLHDLTRQAFVAMAEEAQRSWGQHGR
jgi:hypothetical protein